MVRQQDATSEILARETLVIAPTLARYTQIVAEYGQGSYIYARDGRKYLDFAMGIATNNVGHCHPRVVQAAVEQTKKLIHGAASVVHYEQHVELAEKLVEITPPGIDMCFFANSGAEAVEGAVKLARYVSGRPIIISFIGGFHGRTYGAVSLTSSKAHYRAGYQPLMPSFHAAPYPYCYRCPMGQKRESCAVDCLSYLDRMLETVTPASDVAAVIIEPLLGEGGYVVPPREYLVGLRQLCDEHGILLILDEVQSGFGRTGKMFAAEHFEVNPDIVSLGKGIASGFPLSAVVASSSLMRAWPAGVHGSTFGGNPVAVAAALASIAVIQEEGLLENAVRMGDRIVTRLRELKDQHASLGDVRGLGLMIGVEFDREDGSPNKEAVARIREQCLEKGLILLSCGTWENGIRIVPPLNVSEAEVDEGLGIFEAALQALQGRD
ncbi:MAG: aspartate aminotransferase family protein [Chloroflexi bacterium]|nr:aspartate aminotransferase family protein [Chloroflexota bacterium]